MGGGLAEYNDDGGWWMVDNGYWMDGWMDGWMIYRQVGGSGGTWQTAA